MKYPPRNIDQSCFDWQKIILKKTDLPYQSKYLALYLATYMNLNRDFAYPGLKTIERETGMSHATVLKYLKLLESEGWIGKQSGSRVESNRYWITFPNGVGQEVTYVSSGEKVGRELTSNNNTNNKHTHIGKSTRFIPPTSKQVEQYAQEKNLTIDPERFCDFYESKGWMVGKNKMKSWQAAARNWNKGKSNGQNGNAGRKNTRGPEVVRAADLLNEGNVING